MAGDEDRRHKKVCVTGAGGYVGSWIVKSLLSNGYSVHGTVRDPGDDQKNGHLKTLEAASENMQLFKADLFEYEDLCSAFSECTGVIHVASPVPKTTELNPQVELFEPAVTGTRNVLNACLKEKVKKVVIVSSLGAVLYNPSWPNDQPMDESCWTDTELCKAEIAKENETSSNGYNKKPMICYFLGKTLAEQEALEFGRRNNINIVSVCPSIVIGPMLQSTMNASSLYVMTFLRGGSAENRNHQVVDVRDVAEAALLVYENPESEGRYICTSYDISARDFVEKIQTLNIIPNYTNYPNEFTQSEERKQTYSSKKLQDLGWKFIPLEDTIVEGIRNLLEVGLLSKS